MVNFFVAAAFVIKYVKNELEHLTPLGGNLLFCNHASSLSQLIRKKVFIYLFFGAVWGRG